MRGSSLRHKNVFTISSWVCGRGFGRSASLQILAIAKLLLWFAPRNPSRSASPTPSFEIMNTFLANGFGRVNAQRNADGHHAGQGANGQHRRQRGHAVLGQQEHVFGKDGR